MIFFFFLFLLTKEPEIRIFLKSVNDIKIKSEDKILSSKNILSPPLNIKLEKGSIKIYDFCGQVIDGGKIVFIKPKEKNLLNFEETNYRGSLLLIENNNKIMVINKLPLEDYLLGVVPKEMGPKMYPSLEALKAQAIVARSYGYFKIKKPDHKYYDLCATPACQVYGGASAEAELSNNAVKETKGIVLVDNSGEVQETFYMATCGGHTAFGKDIFPLGDHSAFFQSKPCFELPSFQIESKNKTKLKKGGGSLNLFWDGNLISGIKKYFGIKGGKDLCLEFLNFLKEKGRNCDDLFSLPYFKDLYIQYLKGEKEEDLLWELSYKIFFQRGEMKTFSGIFSFLEENMVYFLQAENPFCLSNNTLLFLKRNNDNLNMEKLSLFPGDKVEAILYGENILALEKTEPMINEFADGRAEKAKWLIFLKNEEIAKKFKIDKVEKLEVLSKSNEGRVLKLKISDSKKDVILERLDVRFKLGLPEILFEIIEVPDGYYFYGSGWGHGVGLCQEGAFGMGSFGLDFESILSYYYPNFYLGKLN